MRDEAPPTVRQIYAIAAALCEQVGAEFPRDRGAASRLIKELRGEDETNAPVAAAIAPVEGGAMAK
jgi:tellurite resistance protein